ncbi:hypothetical protein Sez_0940 [Streptococcus equi subsp. zooepidemicus MGCS10565]|uniref:Uncharacterized protein n=1 Tax=Streptococcus equi subsp. zooepidemicus (strain MGCS10565) TaxID=552526 RepID=B4U2T1_STREM|nr:hypothetical protein Sez_0940 [Streptococcus equi subsp. zooepidemicus MGCS10565]
MNTSLAKPKLSYFFDKKLDSMPLKGLLKAKEKTNVVFSRA